MQDGKTGCSAVVIVIIGVIALLLILTGLMKWVLIGAGLLVAGIIALLLVLNHKDKVRKKKVVAEGMTVADVDNIIKQSNAQLQEIRRNYYKLKDPEMQKELDAISNQFRQIFKIIKEDPKDIKTARRYINTTFLSLSTIVNQSVQLFQAPNLSDEAKASLNNAKEGMRMIREATDKQMNKFYENNILDLDVELAVLKKSLSARGLLEEAAPASEDDERKEQL